MLATNAMHSYGHQWVCQLIYNPRIRKGLGLTDGEGVERIWSRFHRLIGLERRSGVRCYPIPFPLTSIPPEITSSMVD